jgi:hypothetical protein
MAEINFTADELEFLDWILENLGDDPDRGLYLTDHRLIYSIQEKIEDALNG